MKVILLKDIRGLGQAHEVKDVADGYASNFLFPHKYAVVATEDKLTELEARKAQAEAARAKEEEQLASKIQSLDGKQVTISARATEKGGLFKALGPADICKAIRAEHSLEIPEGVMEFEPIKALGEHKGRLAAKAAKANFSVVVAAQ